MNFWHSLSIYDLQTIILIVFVHLNRPLQYSMLAVCSVTHFVRSGIRRALETPRRSVTVYATERDSSKREVQMGLPEKLSCGGHFRQ